MIKILIIDDDYQKRFEIVCFFKTQGIFGPSITECDNVTSALSELKKSKFDMVCLDLNLPMRENESPKEDGGTIILDKLSNPQFIKPQHIFGLTNYAKCIETQREKFERIDFHLYDFRDHSWKEIIKNRLDWIKDCSRHQDSNRVINEKIYVLVHGIMTEGSWQKELEFKIKQRSNNSIVISYKYSYYSAFNISLGFTRRKQVLLFSKFLQEKIITHPESEINLIGHSFGTYLVIKGLENLELDNLPQFSNIFLSGSVLRSDYDFSKITKKYTIKKIINDCGVNDIPLIFSKTFCFGLGHAGRIGFNSSPAPLVNRFHSAGHSIYKDIPNFLDEYWVDTLERGCIKDGGDIELSTANKLTNLALGIISPFITYTTILIIALII